jgi:molecular chaperone GrpE
MVRPGPDKETENKNNKENKSDTGNDVKPEDLTKALAEEKAKAEANLNGWQRAQADFINYKRFAEQDKAETSKFANVNLLASILPILDDLERALAAIPPEDTEKKWVEGLSLINRKFKDTLRKQGVTQIQVLGMEFDPHIMEAITTSKGKKDMVVQEIERGYKLQDRVIRAAKVMVGSGEEEAEKEE